MQSNQMLTPPLSFYRSTFIFGSLATPISMFVVNYFDHDLPDSIHYFLLFSVINMSYYILSYVSPYFIENIRQMFIIAGLTAVIFFINISYQFNFMYHALVAQILIFIPITFVIINIKELIYILGAYWFSDMVLIFYNWDKIIYDGNYQFEFLYFHVFIFLISGICFIAMLSRKLQAEKFEVILQAKEQALDKIKESQKELENLRQAVDSASIVAITDAFGVITYINDHFTKLSGYSSEEALGQTHRLVNSGHHPPEFFENLWKTITTGQVWKGEIKNKNKNGNYYWVDTTIVPLKDNQNTPIRFLSIRNDITARKIAEENLKDSESIFRNLYKSIKEDLHLARETQRYLMPRLEPIPGVEWKSSVNPLMEVSGDVLTTKIANNNWDVLLADIAGHGLGAALISTLVAHTFQVMTEEDKCSEDDFSPSKSLNHLRNSIQTLNIEQFVCGVYFRLDLDNKLLTYSYAGFLPGFLHREGVTISLEGKGTPLLPKGDLALEDYSIGLQSGDEVVFFTDGFYEILNDKNELLGYEKFKYLTNQVFRKSGDIVGELKKEIMVYCSNKFKDDYSIFYMKIL